MEWVDGVGDLVLINKQNDFGMHGYEIAMGNQQFAPIGKTKREGLETFIEPFSNLISNHTR
jgi:hypothetical protein